MASWAITAQLTTGTMSLNMSGDNASDHIWLCGADFGTAVDVGVYNLSTHVATGADVHRCSTAHVHNIYFSNDVNHYKLDGGGETAFSASTPTTGQCPLKFTFSDASAIRTVDALFFAYDGTTEANQWADVTFYAFEKTASNTPVWSDANGLSSAIDLVEQATPATSHDFFIGFCATPSSNGEKSGKVKIKLSYI